MSPEPEKSEGARVWPRSLIPASGPIRAEKLDGAAAGMGEWGDATRALAASGVVPPDMLTGMTLSLLSSQPRDPDKRRDMPGGGGGVAGGVWVRERFTVHRPLARDDAFTVSGESLGRHVHKSRRYGTTASRTVNAAGERVATNLTTGLLAYRVQADLADSVEGAHPDSVAAPEPDWSAAAANPSVTALRALEEGSRLGGNEVVLALELMQARDTKKPDNPIHSDPELARKAGLSRPIAGGSHVLAFALEGIMRSVGGAALLHGACFDVRWKAPVLADASIVPWATVVEATRDRVTFDLAVRPVDGGATAMSGRVTVPLPRAGGGG